MEYMLNEKDVKVIKSALKAHINQCEEFLKLGSLSKVERIGVEDKVRLMRELLDNM